MNWHKYPNFTEEEFMCSHTGECHMDKDFMKKLQALRTEYGKPINISSAYRHPTHPIEKDKTKPGEHTLGKAIDVPISRQEAYKLLKLAIKHDFTRFGISQKGNSRFLHLGTATEEDGFLSPTIWSY